MSTRLYEGSLSCEDALVSIDANAESNRMQWLHQIVQTNFGQLARFPKIVDWSTLLASCVLIFLGGISTCLPKR